MSLLLCRKIILYFLKWASFFSETHAYSAAISFWFSNRAQEEHTGEKGLCSVHRSSTVGEVLAQGTRSVYRRFQVQSQSSLGRTEKNDCLQPWKGIDKIDRDRSRIGCSERQLPLSINLIPKITH